MAEFYFTAAIANGYEYRNTPDNYRHFLMELPVNKEELTYIFKEKRISGIYGCGRGAGAYKERCRPYKPCPEYGVLQLYSQHIRL